MRKYAGFAAFIISTIFLLVFVQFSIGNKFGDPDGYYHVGMGQLWQERNVDTTFPWLQQTVLAEGFADQHFLLHIFLIPFNSIFLGKIFIIIGIFTSLIAFYAVARQLSIRFPLFWTAVLALCSSGFLFRINLLKAETVSLAALFFAILFFLKQRYFWLFPVAVLYTLFYSGGIMLLPGLMCILIAAEYLIHKKLRVEPLVLTVLGVACGIAIHPQQTTLLPLLLQQLQVPTIMQRIGVGVEWSPYTWRGLLYDAALPVVGFLAGFVLSLRTLMQKKNSSHVVWMLVISSLTILGLLMSRRLITYATPFCILFLAYALNPNLQKLDLRTYKNLFFKHWQVKISTLLLIALVVIFAGTNIRRAQNSLNYSPATGSYKDAAYWLLSHAPRESVVLNTHWDQFPQLFFYNRQNYYITGLDSTFMYRKDEHNYWTWWNISDDNPETWSDMDIYSTIKDDFNSSYIFLEKYRNPYLYIHLSNDTRFTRTYEDDTTAIFSLN